ncbi:MAG: ATP-binding protein [Desulfococcaceae bacterium]
MLNEKRLESLADQRPGSHPRRKGRPGPGLGGNFGRDGAGDGPSVSGGMERPGEPLAHFSVADNGVGMAENIIHRIFDPFFTDKFLGRGLGLPIVLGIVQTSGGCIAVQSRPGEGSTITVFLPPGGELGFRQFGIPIHRNPGPAYPDTRISPFPKISG